MTISGPTPPTKALPRRDRVTLKGGKKPERLLRRIIEMSTDPGDLVLDYHMGSGTTCAVAHKLGRRYIGVEQLDYGDNDSLRRLRGVVGRRYLRHIQSGWVERRADPLCLAAYSA